MNLMIGIDFTASNGRPNDPTSLHHLAGVGENCYEQAIREVGSVLAPYDADQRFPAYGFGALETPSSPLVSHCFPLNADPARPEIVTLARVLAAYRERA